MALTPKPQANLWFNRILVATMLMSVIMLLIGLLAWQAPLDGQIQLAVGQIAPNDIVSPSEIRYESQIATESARQRAVQAVPDQYDSTEGRVRRQQVNRIREILEFISLVRSDAFAAPEQKIEHLSAITDLGLSPESAEQIRTLAPLDWNAVMVEAPQALDRVMREEIRESALAAAQRRVPSLISADLSEEAGSVTATLVRALLRANSLFNQVRTDELRNAAYNEAPIQYNTLQRGETIIRTGERVTAEDVEALAQVGLLQKAWDWWVVVRATALAAALLFVVIGALYRLRPSTLQNYHELALLLVITVIWLLAAKFMIVQDEWLPYLYPLAAMGMLITVLIDLRVTLIWTVAFALIIHYMGSDEPALVAYFCIGTLTGSLVLGRAEGLTAFLWAGLAVVASNLLSFIAFRSAFAEWLMPGMMRQLVQAFLLIGLNGGLSASVALLGYFILGNLFNITTSLQLTELSRPTHPLLRQLLLKASGTYHHTILVSNLAERAAATIGADAYLARVGAYYHDIGKTLRPYFFTENIAEGASPHEKLDPLTSAQIIISHVSDGIDLAQKYRLPQRIQDFIREHHGRTLAQYFYKQAQREADDGEVVNEADFRYPGPSPRSKETAILMLADTCEAAVRAIRPASREELASLVHRLIDERVAEGELNESNLTFKDLQSIKDIFLHVLQGVHHPRVAYPESIKQLRQSDVQAAPATPAPPAPEQAPGPPIEERSSVAAVTPGGVEESVSMFTIQPLDHTARLL